MGISLTLDNLGSEHTKTSPDYSFLLSTKTSAKSATIFFYSGILINKEGLGAKEVTPGQAQIFFFWSVSSLTSFVAFTTPQL